MLLDTASNSKLAIMAEPCQNFHETIAVDLVLKPPAGHTSGWGLSDAELESNMVFEPSMDVGL